MGRVCRVGRRERVWARWSCKPEATAWRQQTDAGHQPEMVWRWWSEWCGMTPERIRGHWGMLTFGRRQAWMIEPAKQKPASLSANGRLSVGRLWRCFSSAMFRRWSNR